MIPNVDRVLDVGADHALLDIYLARKYSNTNFLAIDISEKALENALKNIKEANLESRIKILLNNGLDNISLNKDDFIVLSGLGTNTIIKIIEKRANEINNVLIQSNRDLESLRRKMYEFGFKILEEKIIFDHSYYVFIKFKKGKTNYNNEDFWLGPLTKKSKNYAYFEFLIKKYKKILPGIPDNDLKKIEIVNRIKYLENLTEKK